MKSFDLTIDDLLLNLQELVSWPTDDRDWHWQPELQALVETNDKDARLVAERLAGGAPQPGHPVACDDPPSAPLTDFQDRDLQELLGLAHGANFSVPGAGKTRVTLANFVARRSDDQVLRMCVVAPKSAFESWRDEAVRLASHPPPSRWPFTRAAQRPRVHALLVNYERLPEAKGTLIAWLRQMPRYWCSMKRTE